MKKLHVIVFFVLVMVSASAQKEEKPQSIFSDDILLTELNPLHSFGIFTFNTPFYIGAFKTKGSKFTVGYSFGNTWHPKSTVYYPLNITALQQEEANSIYMTERPMYFYSESIKTEQKSFSSDGVLQNLSFTYLWQMGKKGSFIFKLNSHLLSGGKFPLHYLASDGFIEWFHKQVNLYDNFGRRQFDFNKAHVDYQDESGKKVRIEQGEAFLGTFDINYYKPIWRKENSASYHSFQLGTHLTIPLNTFYPKVAGGISGCLLYRKRIFPRFYADFAGDFSLSHYSLFSLQESVNMIDRNIRISAKSYLTFNLVSQKERVYSIGLVNNYQDAFLKGYIFSRTQDEYQDLGVSYLHPGDTWEGEEVNQEVRLSKLTAASMYFFSIKSYLLIGCKGKKSDFSFTIGEDYLVVNNAPDIQLGLQYTRRFGW